MDASFHVLSRVMRVSPSDIPGSGLDKNLTSSFFKHNQHPGKTAKLRKIIEHVFLLHNCLGSSLM